MSGRPGDPVRGISYYRLAERYSRRAAGNFRTRMGLARIYFDQGDDREAKRLLAMAQDVALAHQIRFVDQMQEQMQQQTQGSTDA